MFEDDVSMVEVRFIEEKKITFIVPTYSAHHGHKSDGRLSLISTAMNTCLSVL